MEEADRSRIADLAKTPEQADEARELLAAERFGTLSTHSVDHPGHPFGSVVPYAVEPTGDVIILTSTLAEHTRNFLADPHASLFVRDTSNPQADPQVLPRVTLLGTVGMADADEVSELFRAQHPKSVTYTKMSDFAFYRLEVTAIRYVGGFGRMSWMEPAETVPPSEAS